MKKRGTSYRTLAVGVTGGIASGKSEVCAVFRRLGATVIYSDALAKELLSSDASLRRKIVRLLGPGALTARGRVDRRYVAGIIFRNPVLRRKVNAIVHPAVIAHLSKTISAEKKKKSVPVVAVESALIFEARISSLFDAVIVVRAPASVRLERIRSRDAVTSADARRRIAAQSSQTAREKEADLLIVNRGDLKSLRASSRFVFGLLRALSLDGRKGPS